MLNETLKTLRKQKGYSQEEAASRLNVVRQTISKWEKGLSVPDADMLVRLAELYEVSVSDLLGAPAQDAAPDQTPDVREMAEQLSRINEQLVIKNRRAARIWKIVGISILSLLALQLILMILSVTAFTAYRVDDAYTVETNQELIEDEIP